MTHLMAIGYEESEQVHILCGTLEVVAEEIEEDPDDVDCLHCLRRAARASKEKERERTDLAAALKTATHSVEKADKVIGLHRDRCAAFSRMAFDASKRAEKAERELAEARAERDRAMAEMNRAQSSTDSAAQRASEEQERAEAAEAARDEARAEIERLEFRLKVADKRKALDGADECLLSAERDRLRGFVQGFVALADRMHNEFDQGDWRAVLRLVTDNVDAARAALAGSAPAPTPHQWVGKCRVCSRPWPEHDRGSGGVFRCPTDDLSTCADMTGDVCAKCGFDRSTMQTAMAGDGCPAHTDTETAPPPSGDPKTARGVDVEAGPEPRAGSTVRHPLLTGKQAEAIGVPSSSPASAGDNPGEAAGLKSGANPTANAGNAAPAASPSEPEPGGRCPGCGAITMLVLAEGGLCWNCTYARGITDTTRAARAAVPEEPRRADIQPPPICPGSGTVPSSLRGRDYSTAAIHSSATCGLCGETWPVDFRGALAVHGYQPRLSPAAAPKVEDPCGDVFGNPGVMSWNCRLPRGHEAGHSIFVEDACVSVLRARLAALEEVARAASYFAGLDFAPFLELYRALHAALANLDAAARLKETTP